MRVFKTAWFDRFAKREKLADLTLLAAVKQMEAGRIDADLGGFVIKQRIARSGGGKSGGYRTILAYKKGDKAFFVYGFAKNKQDNISQYDLVTLKKQAKELVSANEGQLKQLIELQAIKEITS